jgi:hypothetical protein
MLRCPRDISPYCEGILNLALEYVSYDPNFTDSMEEDTDDEVQDEEDDEYVIYSCNTKTLTPIITVTSLTFSQ